MKNTILLVIIIFLLIILFKNLREGYIDYAEINEDLMKKRYANLRDDVYKTLENNTDCRTLDNINTQKTMGKYMRMPCKSVDGLKEDDKCKKKVCEATPGCVVKNKKCLSLCGSIKGKDENELKRKCESEPNCSYNKNNPVLKDRCFYQKREMIPQTSIERYQAKCNLVNTICKEDDNPKCVQNLCDLNQQCVIKNKQCILNTNIVSDSLMNNPQGIVDKDSFAKDSGRYAKFPSAIDTERETVIELKNPFKKSILDKIYDNYYKKNNYSFNTFFDDVKDFTITTEYCKKEKTFNWENVKDKYLHLKESYPKIKKIEIWKCDHLNYNNDIEKKILNLFDTWFENNREKEEINKDFDDSNKNYNEMNNYNNSYSSDDFNRFYNTNDRFNEKQKQKMSNIFSRDIKTLNQSQKLDMKNFEDLDQLNKVDEVDKVDKVDKDFYKMSNSKNQNIIVKKQKDRNDMPIVQQHIKGIGNIYAPEIIIR